MLRAATVRVQQWHVPFADESIYRRECVVLDQEVPKSFSSQKHQHSRYDLERNVVKEAHVPVVFAKRHEARQQALKLSGAEELDIEAIRKALERYARSMVNLRYKAMI